MRQQVYRCERDGWELVHAYPDRDLDNHVVRYTGYRECRPQLVRWREPATAIVPFIISLGPAFRIGLGSQANGGRDYRSFVAGLNDDFARVEAAGATYCVQMDLTPLGAYRLLHLPMSELAGRVVTLRDVIGADVDDLAGRLYDAGDWAARFALLDRFVRRRLADGRPPSPAVAWAWQQLVSSRGRVRIDRLTDALGCSRKHLAQRFAAEVGKSPKTVARILRFQHACALMRHGANRDWTGIAFDCGYADQAHMIREFRSLAGLTPVGLARLDTGEGGVRELG